MDISFDPEKRERTLAERGLDFLDAPRVFAGLTYTLRDERAEYPEARYQTYGVLRDRLVMIVWSETPTGGG